MELRSKLFEQIAINTRPKIEEHMLIVMDKSTQEEHLYQPLQTINKDFKIAVTFLTSYNEMVNVNKSKIKFYFRKTLFEEDFFQITIPPGPYEIESLNKELKKLLLTKVIIVKMIIHSQ